MIHDRHNAQEDIDMGLRPRRAVRKRDDLLTGPLSLDAQWFLRTGFCLDGCRCALEQDPERARRLWQAHGQEILEDYKREGRAGQRPYGFWVYRMGLARVPKAEAANLQEQGLLEPWEREAMDREIHPEEGRDTE